MVQRCGGGTGGRRRVAPGMAGAAAVVLLLVGSAGPALASGPAPGSGPLEPVIPAATEVLTAAAADTAVVRGRVVAAEGAGGVAEAEVTLVELGRTVRTDGRGRFQFGAVAPGEYTVRAQGTGYSPGAVRVRVPGAGRDILIRLELAPFHLPEVVVTASLLGGPVAYQPAQAYGLDELRRRTGTSMGEMLDGEPGLAMRSFGAAPARPVIRGLDGDRVLVLENGERMGDLQETAADHAIAVDPLALQRVEVVRGPASLLYGSSALGGVVNLFNDDMPQSWAYGTAGSVALQAATVNGLGAGHGRVVHGTDRWAATGRFSYRRAGDLMTPEGTLPGTHTRMLSGAGGFGYAGPRFEGGASVGLHDHVYGIPEELDDPDEDVEIRMARQSLQGRAAWRADGLVENVELRVNAARFDQQEMELERLPGGGRAEELELSFLQHTVSSTLTLQHTPVGRVAAGAVGVSVFARNLDVGGAEAFTPGARALSLAAFAFQELQVADRVRIQLGGRVESQWMRPLPNEHFADVAGERRTESVSGAVGVNLRPLDALELGAQLARAHRLPTVEELFADGPHRGAGTYEIGDPGLANEVGHGLDVFASWVAPRWRVEAAAFVNQIDNFVIFQPTGAVDEASGLPIFRYEGDNARLVGGEVVVEARLTDALRSRVGADYVRGARRDQARTPLPFIPPVRGRLGLTWEAGAWRVGGEARLVSSQHRVAPEEDPTPGYTLLGFDAGYTFDSAGRHRVALRVDNALNTAYRDHLSRVEDRNFPMPGRNVNVTYRWQF